jgi:steroid 5-alpha reductase family enzyme
MSFVQAYLTAGLIILLLMILLWIASLVLQNASIIDIFWGAGFVITAWSYFLFAPPGQVERQVLVLLLVSVWGLRLSLHIFRRNHGRGEDFRYVAWRKQHGARWWWLSFFQVFLLQGFLLWVISIPLLAAQFGAVGGGLTWLDGLGSLVWGIGFFFEAAGDRQMERFKADPANRGKLFSAGLWRYSRHPNYFGDAAQWWGYYLLALAAGGWWTVYSPLIMTLLLLRVSGVTLLEKTLVETKPGYREYVASTSAFFPWFPRHRSSH